jgi:phosphoribosyl 1,2-cyclic phosphodiesterase
VTSPTVAELVFLGTGASGGTPGRGRSRRLESSALVCAPDGRVCLLDVTRDLPVQARSIPRLDLVLLTHAHRDATGGIPALGRLREPGSAPVPVLAHPATLDRLRERYRRLDHLELVPFTPGEHTVRAGWRITAVEVPHAHDPLRFPTYAWRLANDQAALVYASDVGRLTPDLAAVARGADVLVLDAAMWGRTLFAHLRGDHAVPEVCRWPVERILLTQIGRTAPPHAELTRLVASLCPRARPAYDGLRAPL